MLQSTASLALFLATGRAPLAAAFSPIATAKHSSIVSTQLHYRSLHHGPDVEPLSDAERLGADSTKMARDKIRHYGPSCFAEYAESPHAEFDGGDSEMGLSGDGTLGLRKIGVDVSPHLAWTSHAKMDGRLDESVEVLSASYAEDLLQNNPSIDAVRAQQLENFAMQNEIAMANRHMSALIEDSQEGYYIPEYEYGEIYEDEAIFSHEVEAGDQVDGIITLKAPIHGVAAYDLSVKNPYLGFAKFRAAFVGDDSNEWSVTPNDGFLKQNEATHFIVRYNPHRPGASNAYLVIETEDFKQTYKVVGSTGEYEF